MTLAQLTKGMAMKKALLALSVYSAGAGMTYALTFADVMNDYKQKGHKPSRSEIVSAHYGSATLAMFWPVVPVLLAWDWRRP